VTIDDPPSNRSTSGADPCVADLPRGRSAVEAALIEAAADLLAERGPKATSLRDIAARAKVNRGQIHHYFGSKDALLRQAMVEMARRNFESMPRLGGRTPLPLPLTLSDDRRYWQASMRAAVDGDHELATVEVPAGVSVIRQVLDLATARFGLDEPTLEMRTQLALFAAQNLGWMLLEPLLFVAVGIAPDDEKAAREMVVEAMLAQRLPRPSAPSHGQP
jgi:AcrR family transcriptional regulator